MTGQHSYGEGVPNFMKNKTSSDMPVGKLTRVLDFLPPLHELLSKKEPKKITLSVDKETVRFFKLAAKSSGEKYQQMMREFLNGYFIKKI